MKRTYGKLWLDGKEADRDPAGSWQPARERGALWVMEVEPHVAIKLKRVFGRLRSRKARLLWVRATPETSRDLVWVLQRFPLQVSEHDRAFLQDQADEHDRTCDLVHDVLSGNIRPRHFELAVPLREYQAVAAEAVLQRGGLLLTDALGLGKSAVGIAAIASAPERRPALVVTMTHLCRQWQREFEKFVPGMRTHIAKKGTAYKLTEPLGKRRRGQNALFSEEPDVLILNYAKLAGWAPALAGKVRTVVFDECQELRRTQSNKYEAAKHVADEADVRLGLSATPIYNYGGEFHNVMECVRPDALGSWDEFVTEWCTHAPRVEKTAISDPTAFGTYLRDEGLMLRRTRVDVGRELPPVSLIPHHVDCDPRVLGECGGEIAELCKIILGGAAHGRGVLMRASGEFDYRLRAQTGLAKAPYVARFVDLLVESGEQVVLFGWHHAVYDVWEKELAQHNPAFFTGRESPAAKEKARVAFLRGEARVLCMSLRAGAGLDGLQEVCATAVFGELDWSPGVLSQDVGRIDRDGQSRPVVAYYLIADEGSDPVVADVLGLKREQLEAVNDPNAPLAQPIQTLDRVRKLAAAYAESHDIAIEDEAAAQGALLV